MKELCNKEIQLQLSLRSVSVKNRKQVRGKQKEHQNSMGRQVSPRYGQVIVVSGYFFDSCQLTHNVDKQYQVAGSYTS